MTDPTPNAPTVTDSQWEATAQHHERMAHYFYLHNLPESAKKAREAARRCRSHIQEAK